MSVFPQTKDFSGWLVKMGRSSKISSPSILGYKNKKRFFQLARGVLSYFKDTSKAGKAPAGSIIMADADIIDVEDTQNTNYVFIVETSDRRLRLAAITQENKTTWMQNLKEHKLLSGTYEPDPATEARQTRMRPRASLRLSDFSEQYLVDGEKPNASNAGTMDNWIPRMKLEMESASRDKCDAFLNMHKALVFGIFVPGHLFNKHKHGYCQKRRVFCTQDLRVIRWNKIAEPRDKISGDLEVVSIQKVQGVHHGDESEFASRKPELLVRSFIVVANTRTLNLEVDSVDEVKDWISLFRRLVMVDWVLRRQEQEDQLAAKQKTELSESQVQDKASSSSNKDTPAVSTHSGNDTPSAQTGAQLPKKSKRLSMDYLRDMVDLDMGTPTNSEAFPVANLSTASHGRKPRTSLQSPKIYHSSGRDRHGLQAPSPPAPTAAKTLSSMVAATRPRNSVSAAFGPVPVPPTRKQQRTTHSGVIRTGAMPAHKSHSMVAIPTTSPAHNVRTSHSMGDIATARSTCKISQAFGSLSAHHRRNTSPNPYNARMPTSASHKRVDITDGKAYTHHEFISFYGQQQGERRWMSAPLPGGMSSASPNVPMVTIPRRRATVASKPQVRQITFQKPKIIIPRRLTMPSPKTPPTLPRSNSKKSESWECRSCTFLNDKPHAAVCEICGVMR